ncbi:MAG: PAC2 family protein [Chloroflexi bacterium]|nr:PAC2 family protein [Chloroflexota bacterium]MBA3851945.1 PAC2 family protein [Chloroflexota bacterium]
MTLFRLTDPGVLIEPIVVVAFDGWVDAGSAATAAAARLAEGSQVIATFEADLLFDYRARRPTLEIVDGRPSKLTWPELTVRCVRIAERDVLIVAGPEPDYRWRELAGDMVDLAQRLEVVEWISLGAIPAAVPHTRPIPVMGTESNPGLLRAGIQPGPAGVLRVPSAASSVIDHAVSASGIAALGYYAQIPHYVSGPYPAAALALLRAVGRHLGTEIGHGSLEDEARQLRTSLDAAAALDEQTRTYVERLEAMVDEARLPSGDELISDIERFLRDRGTGRPQPD